MSLRNIVSVFWHNWLNSIAVFNSTTFTQLVQIAPCPLNSTEICFTSLGSTKKNHFGFMPDAKDPVCERSCLCEKPMPISLFGKAINSPKPKQPIVRYCDRKWTSEFESHFLALTKEVENIYINTNEHYRAKVEPNA